MCRWVGGLKAYRRSSDPPTRLVGDDPPGTIHRGRYVGDDTAEAVRRGRYNGDDAPGTVHRGHRRIFLLRRVVLPSILKFDMKICLIRPPSITNPLAYIASLTPPIGLAYIAAAVRAAGFQVELIDGVGEKPLQSVPLGDQLVSRGLTFDEVVGRIPADADIIGISGMFSSEWIQIRDLVNKIGDVYPNKLLIAGGEHFTAAPEISMQHCPRLAACVIGEGEETMVHLARVVEQHGDIATVPGLVIRKKDGYQSTGKRGRIRAVDEIQPPAWDLVQMHNYLDNNLSYGVNRGRSMPILASRGCPYECTFCSNPNMWTQRWIARSPEMVIDEMQRYVETYKVTNFDFYDLTAIVRKDWIVAFCKGLIERKLNVTWQLPSGTRSEAIDAEVSQLLYASGCRNMNYAPESGSVATLQNIKKRVNLSHLTRSLRDAVKNKLNVKLNIIIGLPGERHRDIIKTLWFLIKMSWHGAHDVSVGVFAPYPGSELYQQLVKEKKINHDDTYFSKLAYVDITETVSYSEYLSSEWLRFYNWVGFAVFYGSNYLFRPVRFFATLKHLLTGQHESRGEMALSSLFKRVFQHPQVLQ